MQWVALELDGQGCSTSLSEKITGGSSGDVPPIMGNQISTQKEA